MVMPMWCNNAHGLAGGMLRHTRAVIFLAVICVCFRLLSSSALAAVSDVEALLRNAIYAMTVKGDFQSGVEYARQAVVAYPNEAHPREWLAYGLAGLDRLSEAVEHYRVAAKLRGGLARFSAAWLPLNINSEILELLGAHPIEVSARVDDKRCTAMFIPRPCFTPLLDWRAPKFLERYNQMLAVYRRINNGHWRAAFKIYFKTPALSRDRVDWKSDALSLALSLSLAMCISCTRIGMLPIETQPLSVWLSDVGEPIIISELGHIFWRGVKPGRELAQWFIEAAHEYGHHAFPAFGPFDGGHEKYAGGMMSERLNAIWLLEMLTDGSLSLPNDISIDGLQAQLKAYVVKHFSEDMLSWFDWLHSAELQKPSKMSMRSFLGMIEFIERCYSIWLLEAAMRRSDGEDFKSLLKAFDAQVKKALDYGMNIQLRSAFILSPDSDLPSVLIAPIQREVNFAPPKRVVIPIWLPEGSFECELLVEGADVKAAIFVGDIPASVAVRPCEKGFNLRFRAVAERAWWCMLSIELLGGSPVRLKSLSIRASR
ncbi:MAG: hypothetical protein N2381_04290 [Armatimonadetes bacterium]|nr:hypothetical protein [Armatimonadota bacterium]